MSQNDLSIANQGFASFRSDLNSALQALGSTNSGTSAPSTTYANQLFYDTTNNILKIRNEDNDAFISLFTLDQANDNIESLTVDGILTVATSVKTPLIEFTDGDDALTITDGGNVAVGGSLTANGGVTIDNITIDGTEIDLSSGDLTIDVAGSTIIDSDGDGEVVLKDGGTQYGQFFKISNDFKIVSSIQDGDIVFRGNDGGSGIDAMRIDMSAGGRVGITHGGTTGEPVYPFHVRTDNASSFIAAFWNDGNNANRLGVIIQCGSDDGSGTNDALVFADGNGDEQGKITFNSGTVSYNPFTASHYCIIPNADNDSSSQDNAYPYGTLLEVNSIAYTQKNGADSERGILYNVQKTQSANSKKVLGAYAGSMNGGFENYTNMHQVYVLGDGHILCNNSGGNISVGDGICSSSAEGIGCKATVNPSMIIGTAQEDITFSGSETKLVAVQYGLQQFIPWSS